MHHANVNVNLMVENAIKTKIGIMVNVGASVKNIIYMRKIVFGILLHVVAKNGKYLVSDNSVIRVMKL